MRQLMGLWINMSILAEVLAPIYLDILEGLVPGAPETNLITKISFLLERQHGTRARRHMFELQAFFEKLKAAEVKRKEEEEEGIQPEGEADCLVCHASSTDEHPNLRCSICKEAVYCSAACQRRYVPTSLANRCA